MGIVARQAGGSEVILNGAGIITAVRRHAGGSKMAGLISTGILQFGRLWPVPNAR